LPAPVAQQDLEARVESLGSQVDVLHESSRKFLNIVTGEGPFEMLVARDRRATADSVGIEASPPPPILRRSVPSIALRERAPHAWALAPFLTPLRGITTQRLQFDRGHNGVDIAAEAGTVVTAAASGEVLFAGWTVDDGHSVILLHDGGATSVYKHCERLLVRGGAHVGRGEPIALVGTSGEHSSAPHLHFELWIDGEPRDPLALTVDPERRGS
jgi:murein DD-endopeptidase MepM/ murein hydrolase activator NlpD